MRGETYRLAVQLDARLARIDRILARLSPTNGSRSADARQPQPPLEPQRLRRAAAHAWLRTSLYRERARVQGHLRGLSRHRLTPVWAPA